VERLKTLSLIFLLSFTSFSSQAFDLYGGGTFSFSGVIAEDDFYNGASGWSPGLHFGLKTGGFSTEVFFRKSTLSHEHEAQGGIYEIDVKDTVMGIGLRQELNPIVDFVMGFASQTVSTEYSSSNGTTLSNLKDSSYFSYYVGGGFSGEIYPQVDARMDILFYRGDNDLGLFNIEFGVMYRFLTF
jgi:hypothetical protein